LRGYDTGGGRSGKEGSVLLPTLFLDREGKNDKLEKTLVNKSSKKIHNLFKDKERKMGLFRELRGRLWTQPSKEKKKETGGRMKREEKWSQGTLYYSWTRREAVWGGKKENSLWL